MFTFRNQLDEKIGSGLYIGDTLNQLAKLRRQGVGAVALYEESFRKEQPPIMVLEIPVGMEVDCILYNPPDGVGSDRLLFGQRRAIVQPSTEELARYIEYNTQYNTLKIPSLEPESCKLYLRLIPAADADALAKRLMRATYPERAIID